MTTILITVTATLIIAPVGWHYFKKWFFGGQ